ncbi:MAG: ankyrin repeat domain-containing protein [Alphaproteobacteria bacterium]|nr:ankyrin repeat domain-containing protein [Alphaproteobacteria bacterium]
MFVALLAFALWFSQRDSAKPAASRDDDDDLELTPEREPPSTVFEAADVGDVDALRAMLDERPERIGLRDESGWTPLHHACYRDHVAVIRLLLERGADANAVAVGECVPIHMAATEGGAEAVHVLADGGADLNIPDDTGVTALHYAALPGRLDVVEALIAHGVAVNMKDAKQETALDVARRLDDTEVAQAIEKAGGKSGAEVKMKDVLAALPDGPAKQQVPRAWHLELESEEMQAAMAKAREHLPRFLEHLAGNGEARAAVKFGVRGEGIVEYVWGEVLTAGSPLTVTVTTPPVAVPAPPDPCEVAHEDVVDWQLKLDEDRTAGGYSQRATFEAIRAEYGFLPADIEEDLSHLVDL